jgi:cobalt-zinc-cadmium efflux system outer membrane protein
MKSSIFTYLALSAVSVYTNMALAEEPKLDHLSYSAASTLFSNNSRELLLAKRMLESAQAGAVIAAQKPNPVLSIGVSNFNLNRNQNQGNTNPNGGNGLVDKTLNSSVQINQLLERGNKRELRMAAAEEAIKASNYDLKDTRRQQTLSLAYAYYDLLLAQESEQIQMSNVALYESTLKAAELRLKAGDIANSDVARIRVDALRVKNDLRQAMANHQKAQANIAYLLGKENEASSIVATDQWPTMDAALSAAANMGETNLANKVSQRPDILAAEARTQQAEENRRFANSLKTRDLNLGVQYQHFPGQGPAVGDNTIGAFVSIPLFTNYQYQGEVARSEVEFSAALEAKEQARATAIGEISRSRADLNAAIDKVQRFEQQMLGEAQKASDAAEFAYQHGAIGVTDLLDSRRVLRALQLESAAAHADYAKAYSAWQAATDNEENI